MDHKLSDFSKGQRVESHPATNAWIRGDRYGNVTKVGRRLVHVKMDRSERTLKFFPKDLIPVTL